MKAISFPLLPGAAGAQIANLQAALERLDLGANIPAAERRASQFGPETQSAVKRFQKAHSIASNPPGSVDAATAEAFNRALYEHRILYRLVGQVTGGEGLDGLYGTFHERYEYIFSRTGIPSPARSSTACWTESCRSC